MDGTLREMPISGFTLSRSCGILLLENKTVGRATQKWLDLLLHNGQ
jgi:hypothetical protein